MNLIVFDIDGTLVKYHRKRNDRAYVRAVKDVFNIEIQDSWDGYKTSTDSGILMELVERHHGQKHSSDQLQRFKNSLASFLLEEYGPSEPYEAMEGAKAFIEHLSNRPGWHMALGTGNFEFSGWFKLESAGFDLRHLPIGSADDSFHRELVLEAARDRALLSAKVNLFEKITYIGDWTWDVKAADALGWDFIGIGKGKDKEVLESAGAKLIVDDFRGLERLLD